MASLPKQEGGAFALPPIPEAARNIFAILDRLEDWERAEAIDALILRLDAHDVVGRDATGAPILAEELDASWPTVGSMNGTLRAGYNGAGSDDSEEHDHSGQAEQYKTLPRYGLDQSAGPTNVAEAERERMRPIIEENRRYLAERRERRTVRIPTLAEVIAEQGRRP